VYPMRDRPHIAFNKLIAAFAAAVRNSYGLRSTLRSDCGL
jgi:hypothetical protein